MTSFQLCADSASAPPHVDVTMMSQISVAFPRKANAVLFPCLSGVRYKDDCPAEKYIPIYLIVGGVFGAIKNLLNIVQRAKNRHENQDDDNAKTNPFDGILNCFLLAWFIAGENVCALVDRFSSFAGTKFCRPKLTRHASRVGLVLRDSLSIATQCSQ